MEVTANAKINLSLDIIGRRPDGYHNIQMVMQSISLCDSVTMAESRKIEVFCGRAEIPCGPENTVYRAAEAFFKYAGLINCGASFTVQKQIPSQAGLGGGSADAAAALILLNRYFHTGYSVRELCGIGLTVGADVPFCIEGGTAVAEGIGEELKELSPMPYCPIVVCKPPVGVSTKEAYEAFDTFGRGATNYTEQMLKALKVGELSGIAASLGNAFETASVPLQVKKIEKEMLSQGALGTCMTGSGSAVFGLFDSEPKAQSCRDDLHQNYPETFLCFPVCRK